MGHMDVLAILSEGFNIYFPMCVLAFCLATWFSLGARLLSFLGFQQFLGQDEITTDLTDEGRELVRREHRRRQRQSGAEERGARTEGGGGGWGSQAYRAAKQRAEQRSESFQSLQQGPEFRYFGLKVIFKRFFYMSLANDVMSLLVEHSGIGKNIILNKPFSTNRL